MKQILVFGLSSHLGGTESYFLTLYEAIDKSKLQFDFLFPYNEGDIPYESKILNAGGRIYREYYQLREKKAPGAISVREFFQRHKDVWDGVYINVQSINTSYRLLTEARKIGLELRVIHAHNNNYMRKPSYKDKILEAYFHLTKRSVVTNFLACSNAAGKWMFHSSPFTIIPNAVDFRRFAPRVKIRYEMRKQYGLGGKELVVGFCGRLQYQKNPSFVLEIFQCISEQLENASLLIVGDGEERNRLEARATELGLQNKVIFAGSVSNVEDYMQIMDVFLLPSRFEGFGIVLLEAQAAGLECFTSDKVVPQETNVTGHVHFVSLEQSAKYWADEILRIGCIPYDCMDMLLSSQYTVKSSVQKLMQIFEPELNGGLKDDHA